MTSTTFDRDGGASFVSLPRHSIILIAALALVVFGSKLIFLQHYGSPVPYWDQWDAEAGLLYPPFLDHSLPLSSLFASHNEHRIFFTRILALCLLVLSGQWDPVLQMIVNAMLHTAVVVLLVQLLMRGIDQRHHWKLTVLCALAFSLPIGWENLFAGFQSQFYFVILFSILSFTCVIDAAAFTRKWLIGIALAVAAYFSLASGTFAFFVLVAISGLQITSRVRSGNVREWLGIVVLCVASAVCLSFLTTVPAHASLKAKSISEFFVCAISLAGFPFSTLSSHLALKVAFLILSIGPFIVLLLRLTTSRTHRDAMFVVAVFLFVAMQIASVSYGRAQGFFAPRYLDLVLLLVPAGFAALCMIDCTPTIRKPWLVLSAASLIHFTLASSSRQVVERGFQTEKQLQNVKSFLATGDIASLSNKAFLEIPYPSAERLAMLLSKPEVRAFLPAELRPSDEQTLRYRYSHLMHPRLYAWVAGAKSILLSAGATLFGLGAALILFWPMREARDKDNATSEPLVSDEHV